MRLGVFGGTFNPVHYGHLRAAEEAVEALALDKVLFVPAGSPPLKQEGLASIEDRLRMVELAIADNPAMELSRVESSTDSTSYTVDTLRTLSGLHPRASLVFILGVDAFSDIHLWKDPEALLSLADFLVLGRPGHPFAPISGLPYVDISQSALEALASGRETRAAGTLKEGGRRLELLRITPLGVSATMLRELLRRGESIRYLLPESVESFIMSHGLYTEAGD